MCPLFISITSIAIAYAIYVFVSVYEYVSVYVYKLSAYVGCWEDVAGVDD